MRKLILRSLILLVLVIQQMIGYAQPTVEERIERMKNVIPPSPNASAIEKYGEWPVSLYTGLPQINIPIYTLSEKSISVPVQLNYHAGGIKVGDIASWVGLGWSLEAGGAITRSIRGLPDEVPSAGALSQRNIYTNPNDMCSFPVNTTDAKNHKVQSAKGLSDSEFDLYSLSALGKSFKFFIKADGTIVTMPYSNVKIITNFGPLVTIHENVYWNVLFEDGTKLVFGGLGYLELNTNPRFDIGASSYPTSWMLKSIQSPTGDIVNFSYTSSLIDQDSYFSESDKLKYNISTLHQGGQGELCPQYIYDYNNRGKAERQQMLQLQVSTIESDLCRIDFIQNDGFRLDLKNGKSLSAVKVYSKVESKYIQVYNFNYNYSDCAPGNEYLGGILSGDESYYRKRLKLTSLDRKGSDNAIVNTWKFNYNSTQLPSRRSYAQDHWGFYNGALTNTTLLPNYFYPLPNSILQNYKNAGFNSPVYNQGANREGNDIYSKAETIESIEYPTGGKSTFYLEANSIPVSEEQFTRLQSPNVQLNLNSLSNPYLNSQQLTFAITKAQNIKVLMSSYISSGIINDMPTARVSAIVKKQGTSIEISGITSPSGQSNFTSNTNFNLLEPGTYILELSTNVSQQSFGVNDAIIASASVQYDLSLGIQQINKNVGGLRLQRMVIYDGISHPSDIDKYFQYENPLISSPPNIERLYFTETEEYTCENPSPAQPGGGGGGYMSCHNKVVTRNSSTKYSYGDIGAGTVGYGKVTTLIGINGVNGRNESEFNNDPDMGLSYTEIFPYPPSESRNWHRGLLLRSLDKKQNGSLVREELNSYEFFPKHVISSFKAGIFHAYSTSELCPTSLCGDAYGDCGIQKVCYAQTSEQVNLTSKISKIYQEGVASPLVTSEVMSYDNAYYTSLTKVQATNSKGEQLSSEFKYPFDFMSNSVYSGMVSNNIIDPVIETRKLKGISNAELAFSRVNYSIVNSNMYLPVSVEKSILAGPVSTELVINSIDSKGNVTQTTAKDGVVMSYVWGYGQHYPVAKIFGKSYMEAVAQSGIVLSVINSLTSTDAEKKVELNKLRTLTGCFVTTYTYKPLVGISTETDPNGRTTYYEYDKFNRLVLVRDFQFKILKKICYNYSGQPVDCQSTPLFFNTMQSQTFTRNNCGSCSQGSVVNYVVPENTFSSTVSIPDANQLALNDIAQNGQAYANANGTCGTATIPLTYNNQIFGTGGTGFTAVYSTKAPGPSYTFNIPGYGSGSLGCIPAGLYTLTISKPGNGWQILFNSGCAVQSGTSAVFGKVNPATCPQITLQLDAQ